MSEKVLAPGRMRPAEASWRSHAVLVESGMAREALLAPSFWGAVAGRLRVLDRIEAMDDAATWVTVLMVRAVGQGEASVVPLWSVELENGAALSPPAAARFVARWRGHRNRWAVMEGETVLRDGMGSREEAELWIASHVKAMAA